jgi:hypothetical protein
MAVALIQEFKAVGTDRTTTNYDHAVAQLDLEANPPPGLIVHTAGWDETAGVFRVHSVLRSADEAEAFVHDRLEPVLARGPVNLERTGPADLESMYELHHVVEATR